MMTRYLSVVTLLLALPLTNAAYGQVVDSSSVVKSLNRCWRAFSHEYATVYGLEEDEIKAYSKQRVCLGSDSVHLYYGASYSPRYSIKKVNAESYSRSNFDCSKRNLSIMTDSMYEVTISSVTKAAKDGKVKKMTDVLAFDGECIYVVVDGVIFKLLDADSKVQPRSSN